MAHLLLSSFTHKGSGYSILRTKLSVGIIGIYEIDFNTPYHYIHKFQLHTNAVLKPCSLIECLEREWFDEWYTVYLYVVNLCTEFDRLCFFTSYYGTYIMMVNAENAITDLPYFKHFLLLHKNLSSDGKTLPVILNISEWSAVPAMNPFPLIDEFFKKSDHMTLEHPCPWSLSFSFLAVEQIRLRYIRIVIARTPYAKFLTMFEDIPVEPFENFPKEFHICWETHVAFIACGIDHVHVKVLKIRSLVWGRHFLEEFNVKMGYYLKANGTDYLVVGYREGRGYYNSAEHLAVYDVLPAACRRIRYTPSGLYRQSSPKEWRCFCVPSAVPTDP